MPSGVAALVASLLSRGQHLWLTVGSAAVVVASFVLLVMFYAQVGPYRLKPLRIELSPWDPEPLPEGRWKLSIFVVNNGETGTFTAPINSEIEGVTIPGSTAHTPYRSSPMAWEGGPSDRNQIWGDGGPAHLVVAEYEPHRRMLRFIAPQSTYSGAFKHQAGREVQAVGPKVNFVLELRETDVPHRYKRWSVELDLTPDCPPKVGLVPVP